MEHQLGDIEIADDTIFQGSNGDNVGGCAANHALGIRAHRERTLGLGVYGNHGGLVDNNALTAYQNERVRRTEIDPDIPREHAHDAIEWVSQGHLFYCAQSTRSTCARVT